MTNPMTAVTVKQISKAARSIERLKIRRAKLVKQLDETDAALREAKRFMRGIIETSIGSDLVDVATTQVHADELADRL